MVAGWSPQEPGLGGLGSVTKGGQRGGGASEYWMVAGTLGVAGKLGEVAAERERERDMKTVSYRTLIGHLFPWLGTRFGKFPINPWGSTSPSMGPGVAPHLPWGPG